MNGHDLSIIRGRRVVTPDGVVAADVVVSAGRIVEVRPADSGITAGPGIANGPGIIDAGDALVLPGLVDTHVHVNAPGRTHWEGFETATDAAAAGGVTTIVDMPLNASPVTTSRAALEAKHQEARGKLRVDCGFWGGVVPGNLAELAGLASAGVLGFKCFLVDSGLAEFPAVGADLRPAMREIARLGLPLLAHAELPGPIEQASGPGPVSSSRYADWVTSRPPAAEVEAVELLIRLAAETGCRTHVVHVSSADCLAPLAEARAGGLPISAETCPHYLTFAAADIRDGATAFKCAPPIRSAANRERLWAALDSGALDFVASDHSPCPPGARAPLSGDFFEAWGGIASLQLGSSIVCTGAVARGLDPAPRLASWMSEGPARLAGLHGRKGRLAPGYDADLVIFDPEAEFVVEAANLHDRHRQTPYEGMRLRGVVRKTILGGSVVFADGRFPQARSGEIIEATGRGDEG